MYILFRRCRAKHRPAFGYLGSVPANTPPPVLTNDRYINHFLNHNAATTLNGDTPGLDDNVYAEIDLEYLQATSDVSNNEYNTIEQRTIEIPEHSYEQMNKGMEPFIDTPYLPMDKYPEEKKSETMGNTYLSLGN